MVFIWNGTSGNDTYSATANLIFNVFTGQFDLVWDTWSMKGFAGDDTLAGGILSDDIYGGAGKDTLRGFSGNDDIYGGTGDDLIAGGTGDDLLQGGRGNDGMAGESGDDILNGYGFTAKEVDTLIGGSGADRFILGNNSVYYAGSGLAFIDDFIRAEGDKVQLKGSAANYTLLKDTNYVGSSVVDTVIVRSGDVIGVIVDVTNFALNSDVIYV